MIIENKIDFVMSRDGYILVCQEEARGKYSNYVKIPPSATASSRLFFIPGFSTSTRIARMDNDYFQLTGGIWFHRGFTQALETNGLNKSTRASLQKTLDRLTTVIQGAIKSYTEEYFTIEDTISIEHMAIENTGLLIEGAITYSKPVDWTFNREIALSALSVGKGSDWAFTASFKEEFKACLKAAMLSTDTKEHLLEVLQRIGAVSQGEWLTVQEYVEKHDIAKIVTEQAAKNLTSLARYAAGDDYETLKGMLK